MKCFTNLTYKIRGFTLVEMAIVLVVVGLLVSAFLTPLRMQIELRNNSETQASLLEIRDALIGYALSHNALDGRPFLPCPDTDGDGVEYVVTATSFFDRKRPAKRQDFAVFSFSARSPANASRRSTRI